SNQKLTWNKKDLVSGCNSYDADLWMSVDVTPVDKPE
ncbi:unnamed protein product, partial [Brassica rapa]